MKKAFIQLHVAVFLAGFTAILGKLINLNEGILVWYRLLLTVLILGGILYYKRQLFSISRKDMIQIFSVGGIVAFHWVTFYGSVKYANVSVAVVCLAASGFFTSFFEPLILKRRIAWAEVLLGFIAIFGIYIIFDFHPQYKVGILFGILASVGSSLFPIFNKKLITRFSPKILTFYEITGGLVVLSLILPVYLYFFKANHYLPSVSDIFWLIILAGVCTVVSFDLQLNALKKLSPFTSNLAYNLEPVYGIILGFIIFQENKNLNVSFYWGTGLIILVVVVQMFRIVAVNPNKKR